MAATSAVLPVAAIVHASAAGCGPRLRAAAGRAGSATASSRRGALRPRRHARPRRPLQRRPGEGRADAGRARGAGAAARRRHRLGRGQQPERHRPRPAERRRGRRRQRARRGAARPARTVARVPARAGRRLRVPQAARPAWCSRPPRRSASRRGGASSIGDIGADVGAARAAGARGILVPTPATRPTRSPRRRASRATARRGGRHVLGGE